jgi:hypothetical protein
LQIECLEERTVLSSLGVISAIGIGGDAIVTPEENFDPNLHFFGKVGATAIDNQGNTYFAGEFSGSVNFDPAGSRAGQAATDPNFPGKFDMFVVKYDATGKFVWRDVFVSSPNFFGFGGVSDFANAMAVDGSGNVYLTGAVTDSVNFNPDVSPAHSIISQENFGDPVNPSRSTLFVLKLSSDGQYQNVRGFGGSVGFNDGNINGTSIAVDPSGNNVAIVGLFSGSVALDPTSTLFSSDSFNGPLDQQFADGFALELNSSLSFNWAVRATFGVSQSALTSAAFDPVTDKVYVAGFVGNNAATPFNGSQDIVIGRISKTGSIEDQTSVGGFPGDPSDTATGIVVDGQQNVYVTGTFRGSGVNFNQHGLQTITLDSSNLGANQDVFVAKYDKNFNLMWADRTGSGVPITGDNGSVGLGIDNSNNLYVAGTFLFASNYGTNTSGPAVYSPISLSTGGTETFVLHVDATTGNLLSTGGTPDTFVAGSSNGFTVAEGIAVNPAGRVAILGAYASGSAPSFGQIQLSSLGASNAFVAVLTKPNVPPTINPVPTQSGTQGQPLTVQLSETDPDTGETFTWSLDAAGTALGASINPQTGLFSWTPGLALAVGPYSFTVTVTDSGSAPNTGTRTFMVIVGAHNIPPTVNQVSQQTVTAGQTLTLPITETDPDTGETFTWSLSQAGIALGASINPQTGVFTWMPPASQAPGNYTFTVTVTDSGPAPNSGSGTFAVVVKAPNVPPSINTPIPQQTVVQGDTVNLTITATDPDPQPPETFTWTLSPAGIALGASIDSHSGVFTWATPPSQAPGNYTFTVTVNDGGTAPNSDTKSFMVTVLPFNHAPTVVSVAPQTGYDTIKLTVQMTANDQDTGQTITWNLDAASIALGATIDPQSGVISYTPASDKVGKTVTLAGTATDNGTPNKSGSFSVQVNVLQHNRAPVINTVATQTAYDTIKLTVPLSATDPDTGQTLTWSLNAASTALGATIDPATGIITFTPAAALVGQTVPLTATVTDNGQPGPLSSQPVAVQVTVLQINRAPTVNPVPAQTVTAGQTLTIALTETDPDQGQAYTWKLSDASIQAGASINPQTGVITWTPRLDQLGSFALSAIVTDNGLPGPLSGVSPAIPVTVLSANHAPAIGAVPTQSATVGSNLVVNIPGSDQDPGQNLTYSIEPGGPAGATINAQSGVFTFTPNSGQVGTSFVTVRVTDSGIPQLSTTQTFAINVQDKQQQQQQQPAPHVTGLSGSRSKKGLATVTVSFDEALGAGTGNSGFSLMTTGTGKKKHGFTKPVGFNASYSGSTVTLTLAKPVKTPVQVTVNGNIAATNGQQLGNSRTQVL